MTTEYRTCPVGGHTVILAPARAARPMALEHATPHLRDPASDGFCPFCPGHEWDTPNEVYADRDVNGWTLRVVPNKYPAVTPESDDGFGFHELVIDTPEHVADPTRLDEGQLARVFIAYRERMLALLAVPGIAYVTAFKNVGAEAGASLPHAHSQLIATPFVPAIVAAEVDGAANYFQRTGQDVFRQMLRENARLVARSPSFAVLCPFAPRFEYEMWLQPTRPRPHFETITDEECLELAKLLKRVLTALDAVVGRPAYNWYIHTAPAGAAHYQWHLEIIPRTARAAGYEWATGTFINAVPPERAAALLRAKV